jgi:hypothetical protein
VKLAGKYGVWKTAKALGLDYYALKKRFETGRQQDDPTFMELVPSGSATLGECLIELEDPVGAKMRIHLKGGNTPDLAALSDGFWKRAGG